MNSLREKKIKKNKIKKQKTKKSQKNDKILNNLGFIKYLPKLV